MAAQINLGSIEKGVSWSPQKFEFSPPSPGDGMTINPPNPTPAVPARGSKYRRASNLDKLTAQLNEQVRLAATTSTFTTSLCHGPWHYGGKHSSLNVAICLNCLSLM